MLTILAAMIVGAGQTWAVDLTGWGYNVIGDKFPDALDGTKDMLTDGAGHTIPFTIHNFEQATDVGTDNVTVTPRGSVFIDPEDYANKPAGTYTGSMNGIALSLTISTPVVPIVVTSANVNEIFCGVENATDVISQYCLGPQIPDGAILDIQGYIDYNRSFVINKRVGIFSSTKDATFNLHTVKGDTHGDTEIPKFSFIVSTGASGSVIKDLFIWNTQTWIYNVADVLLKDITISVRSIGLSEEIGHTAVRYCDHLVMDGWNVFTENTDAPSIVFYVVNRSSIINMTIEGQSKIGSLLTLTCPNEVYDAPFEDYVATSTKNTIKNCAFKTGYPDAFPIANDNADYTTIDCIQVNASKNIQTGTNATVINSEFYNASGFDLHANSTAYNNVVYGSSSIIQNGCTVYNNTFNAVTTRGSNVTFKNNTVKNKLTVSSPATIKDNFLNTVEFKSGSNGATLTSNVISGQVTGASENATISDNATVSDNTGVPATATADDNMSAFYYVAENTTVDGDITISKADGAQSPKVTFLIADGAHLTVNGGVSAPDVQMNVYPLGSGQMTVGNAVECKGLNIYGGTVTTGSITATGDIRISNCQMAAGSIATAVDKDITFYECQETTTGDLSAGNICIDGGQVSVNGTISATNISFGWTRMTNIEDEIFYVRNCSGTVTAKGNQRFVAYNTEDGPEAAGIVSSSSNIDISGKTLRRLDGFTVCPPNGITLTAYSRMFTLNNKSYYVYEFLHPVIVTGHEDDYADIHATRPKYGENYFKEGEHQFPMPAQDIDITAVDFYNYGFKYIDADGTEQTTPDGTKVYFLDGGGATTLPGGWYIAEGNVTYTGGLTLTGETHLILADGVKVTVGNSVVFVDGDPRKVGIYTIGDFTVYGQSSVSGTLNVNKADNDCAIVAEGKNITFNSGKVVATSDSYFCISSFDANITVNGGDITSTSSCIYGIYANDVTINDGKVKADGLIGIYTYTAVNITGGTVEAYGDYFGILNKYDITISGGQVTATGGTGSGDAGICSNNGDIHLGYTNADDYIYATSYKVVPGKTVSVDANPDQWMMGVDPEGISDKAYTGVLTSDDLSTIANMKLRRAQYAIFAPEKVSVTVMDGSAPAEYEEITKNDVTKPYYIYKEGLEVTAALTNPALVADFTFNDILTFADGTTGLTKSGVNAVVFTLPQDYLRINIDNLGAPTNGATYLPIEDDNNNLKVDDTSVEILAYKGLEVVEGQGLCAVFQSVREVPEGTTCILANKTEGAALPATVGMSIDYTTAGNTAAETIRAAASPLLATGRTGKTLSQVFTAAVTDGNGGPRTENGTAVSTRIADYLVTILSGTSFRPVVADGDTPLTGSRCILFVPKTDVLSYLNGQSGATARTRSSASDIRYIPIALGSNTTGIGSLTPDPSPMGEGSEYFYTLDGRRLSGRPTAKGVYIHNGRAVVVR